MSETITFNDFERASLKRYKELQAYFAKVDAENAQHEAKLAELNAQIEALQAQANALAGEIDDARGGSNWIAWKKEAGQIAAHLGRQGEDSVFKRLRKLGAFEALEIPE